MPHRVAIYYAPHPESPLSRFGVEWLGRNHHTGDHVPQKVITGVSPTRLFEITASPRHYGFHATIKAPFRLKDGQTVEDLAIELERFCGERKIFEAPLKVASVGGFIALVLSSPSEEMASLEADTVMHFERFRALLEQDEIERRQPDRLTERQRRNFLAYGYPFILEDFRFHMTLTQRLFDPEHQTILSLASEVAAPVLEHSCSFDGLGIYEQVEPGADFICTRRFAFSSRQ